MTHWNEENNEQQQYPDTWEEDEMAAADAEYFVYFNQLPNTHQIEEIITNGNRFKYVEEPEVFIKQLNETDLIKIVAATLEPLDYIEDEVYKIYIKLMAGA